VEPEECQECKQHLAVAAELRKQLGEGQIAGQDDPRGEIKLTPEEIESIAGDAEKQDCTKVCPEVRCCSTRYS
jgi:hypothetical protein